MTIEYKVVRDCDNEFTGEHTCWGVKINGYFWWISINPQGGYSIEVNRADNIRFPPCAIKVCKSLTAAKAWITRNWKFYTGV